ncbi:cytochrome P450 [Xylariaceae sp. FL0255]|nr:cytochrome P450 [Xylariaceae sp. FL0255]
MSMANSPGPAPGRARKNLSALPRAAKRNYYGAVGILALSSTALVADIVFPHTPYLRHNGSPLLESRLILLGLAVFAIYTFVLLRRDYAYYVKGAENGCGVAPWYPRDWLGIRFLLETARAIKVNGLLQQRAELLEELGQTFFHQNFPDPFDTITTSEFENVKAALSTKFEDWVLPDIRVAVFLPILGKHSIFTTNGAEWQHSRAILRPAFVRDQISDLEAFDRHFKKLMARIPRDGSPVDMQEMFLKMTTDSISDFMFGFSTDLLGSAPPESYKFGKMFDMAVHKIAVRARLGWLTLLAPDKELDDATNFLRAFVDKYVKDVRQKRVAGDGGESGEGGGKKYIFLDELIKSSEPDDVIRDHLLSIFTAGRDTTTSVLTYLFLELSRRPDIVDRLRAEIAELDEANPTWEHLRGMKYLNWTVKEALRLNPPVAANQRQAVRDTILPRGGGIDGKEPIFVRKGTQMRYMPWIMHRRREIFGEDADEFRPGRWEDLRVTHEYVPFNSGPRICIGQQFALTQIAFITFRLLSEFKAIERRDDRPPIQKLGVNLTMLHGCWVSLTPA